MSRTGLFLQTDNISIGVGFRQLSEAIASLIRCAHVYTCIYRSFLFWLSSARPFAKLLLVRNFSFRVRVVCCLLGLIESNSSSSSIRAPTHTHAAATSPTNV
uniref:Uncharacterized protein n=1 Tax=Trichogramma kaykai TaxID=54128 RepID=A0ABD2X7X7_9HYME